MGSLTTVGRYSFVHRSLHGMDTESRAGDLDHHEKYNLYRRRIGPPVHSLRRCRK